MPRKKPEAEFENLKEQLVGKTVIRTVSVKDIEFDHSYQRGIKTMHLKIVANYRREALGVPLVARRPDSRLLGVDGQQRLTALGKLGIKMVRVEIFQSRGVEHEAEVCKFVNQWRTKYTAAESFKNLVAARDETALAVQDVVQECGYRIVDGRAGHGDKDLTARCLAAVNTLLWMANHAGGVESIRFTLKAIDACWPGDPIGANNQMLMGMAWWHKRRGGVIDIERLYPRLRRVTPHKIIYTASQTALLSNRLRDAIAEQLEKLYHKRIMNRRSR